MKLNMQRLEQLYLKNYLFYVFWPICSLNCFCLKSSCIFIKQLAEAYSLIYFSAVHIWGGCLYCHGSIGQSLMPIFTILCGQNHRYFLTQYSLRATSILPLNKIDVSLSLCLFVCSLTPSKRLPLMSWNFERWFHLGCRCF